MWSGGRTKANRKTARHNANVMRANLDPFGYGVSSITGGAWPSGNLVPVIWRGLGSGSANETMS